MQIGLDAATQILGSALLWAQQERTGLPFWPVLVVIAVLFYLLIIRPEFSSRKQHEQMLKNLKPGDEVVTIGGLIGRIVNLDNETCTIRVDDNVRVRVLRSAIARTLGEEKKKDKDAQ
ncbi:MAG: preprotein translocase subunit YajC [Pirellulaceae bacterium]|nr:MAG: preprotein translocase subunit YajC [Pirellulaceae bacterium]